MTDTTPATNALINADLLAAQHGGLLDRIRDFERREFADRVDSDEESAHLIDAIKELDKFGAEVEATRVGVKEPFASAAETVDAFFFGLHAPRKGATPGRLQKLRNSLASIVQNFLDRKEAARREELNQEAARQRKIEADRVAAAEAERTKQEAAEEANRPRAAANAGGRAAGQEAEASIAGARAFEAEQQAQAKPADIARVRTDGGALASPKVVWEFTVPDYEAVKGAQLWAYATPKQKEAMIRAFISNNAPEREPPGGWQPIPGVVMVPTRKLQVR